MAYGCGTGSGTRRLVQVVRDMTVARKRLCFRAIRDAAERDDRWWDLALPAAGMTAGEFCMGYLLRDCGD